MPFISIVIPVYNAEQFLVTCLDSVLGQSFDDWEAVLVDDGSTDSSPAICDRYAAQDARVRVIHQPNAHTSAARNSGVAAAQGTYVTFMDNDDWWRTDDCLEKVVAVLRHRPVDLLWHMSCRANADGTRVTETSSTALAQEVASRPVDEAIRFIIDSGMTTSAVWTKVVRRELILEHSIVFPVGMRNEDTDWSAKVIARCESVGWFDERFYVYRMGNPYSQTTRALSTTSVRDLESILRSNLALAETLASDRRETLLAFLAYPMVVWAGQASALGMLRRAGPDRETLLARLEDVTGHSRARVPRVVSRAARVVGGRRTAQALGLAFRARRWMPHHAG